MKTFATLLGGAVALTLAPAAAQSYTPHGTYDHNTYGHDTYDYGTYGRNAYDRDGYDTGYGTATAGLPLNRPTNIDGVRAVCTGIGEHQQNNPRWDSYPAKIVVAGRDGQYLADEHVRISRHGRTVLATRCGGPMLLADLSPGRYRVTAHIDGRSSSAALHVSRRGQHRVVLSFPNAGGAVSATYRRSQRDGDRDDMRTPYR